MSAGVINAVVREKYIGVTGQTLFVARPVTYSRIDTETILARAAENSGIDQGVLAYAFFAIMKTFQNFLFNGHVVELGPLGTFRVSFSCKAGATNEDCNASGIRCRRVIYNLSKRLKRELKEVEFEFQDAEQASPPSPLPEKGGGDEPDGNADGADEVDDAVDESVESVNENAESVDENAESVDENAESVDGYAVSAGESVSVSDESVAVLQAGGGYTLYNIAREGDSGSLWGDGWVCSASTDSG